MWKFILMLSCSNTASGFVSAVGTPGRVETDLRGGYDSTIGVDPSTPIQFFTLSGKTCPYAQRTHIALLELGIPFDMTEVTAMPKPDWYLKINPHGKVPALRVPTADYSAIYESAVCNEFLCDYATTQLHLVHTLMPTDPFARAKVRLLNLHCDNVFTKTQFTYLMNTDAEFDKGLCNEMENALQCFENSLLESKGPYLMGKEFTLADLHVFPFVQRLVVTLKIWKDYNLPDTKFPHILAWFNSCLERESVMQSSMTRDKIIEVYERFVNMDYKFGGLNKNS